MDSWKGCDTCITIDFRYNVQDTEGKLIIRKTKSEMKDNYHGHKDYRSKKLGF